MTWETNGAIEFGHLYMRFISAWWWSPSWGCSYRLHRLAWSTHIHSCHGGTTIWQHLHDHFHDLLYLSSYVSYVKILCNRPVTWVWPLDEAPITKANNDINVSLPGAIQKTPMAVVPGSPIHRWHWRCELLIVAELLPRSMSLPYMRSLGSEIHRFAPFPLSFSNRKRNKQQEKWQFIYQFLQGTCSLPWISTNPNLHDPSCPTWHPWYPELFASSLGVSLQELVFDPFRTWTASPFASKNDIDVIYKSVRIHLSSIHCLKWWKHPTFHTFTLKLSTLY